MKNNFKTPRMWMVVALCVALTALWLVALYGTYEDSQREKYDVRVTPGAVTYGTHSTAIIPTVSVPMRHSSVPMISGGAVRSYAHSGHAATPSATGSGFKMHTTSSATVHTIGSGGGSNNQSPITNHQSSSSSSRGIQTSGVSVSMPTLALATPTYAAQSEMSTTSAYAAAPGRNGRVKKAAPGWNGDEGDTEWDDVEGKWWYWDPEGETWVSDAGMLGSYIGLTRNTGSGIEVWTGDSWVTMEEWQNPGVPVGATPWLLMLLFVGAYGIVKTMHKKQNTI